MTTTPDSLATIAGFKSGRGISHIWINGRDEVFDPYIANAVYPYQHLIEKSKLATEVWEDSREGPHRIHKLHIMNADYRGLRTCCGRSSCPDDWLYHDWDSDDPRLWDRDQLFLFTRNPKKTL